MNPKLFLVSIALLALPSFTGAESVDDVVRNTTEAVLQQLDERRNELETDPGLIQQVVNELIVPHFDFEEMSALVLGSHWQVLGDADKTCFASGFRNLLVERYAYILLSYNDHEITYEPAVEVGERGYRLVRQTISREGASPLPIDYAMQQSSDTWMVVDLIIDGVSLVRNYLGMFQSQIHLQGLDYFMRNFPVCNN